MIDNHNRIAVDPERVVRTVLVLDVVESVRLMQLDEAGAVRHWRAFADEVDDHIVPAHGGRLVKSLGDGLMIEFPQAPQAVEAAFALQQLSERLNEGVAEASKMRIRIGIHVGPLIADARDIYGHGVNLTARLTTLAGPGETVVSADVRDLLTPQLDADIEDLGECYLKHLDRPVRAFRVGAVGEQPVLTSAEPGGELRATIAVIPFTARGVQPEHDVLGQILADDVISALSRSPEINVVSRLSTTAFRRREASLKQMSVYLNADYVVSGSFTVEGKRLSLRVELADTRSQLVAWSKTLKGDVHAVIAGKDELAGRLVADTCAAIMMHELKRSFGKGLPTLESHTILLSSIALMHRISPLASKRAQQMLQALIDRAPRLAAPYAWMGKWHVLRVTQGWTDDPKADGKQALDNARRALDRDATLSLAMTVEGQVNTYIHKRLDIAEECYESALRENPNDSLAWLLKGTLHAFRDEGTEAVRHTRQALKLSPLDPLKYYFDSLAATAALSAGQYERALKLAQASLRLNRTHASTLRALITAQWHLGREEEARATARDLLVIDPEFTVSTFLDRSPAAPFQLGKAVAIALKSAGVPQ
jgi:class 3 adenylate cyclase/TolB-like protein/tetratricopeptide (TPR) repeat protein